MKDFKDLNINEFFKIDSEKIGMALRLSNCIHKEMNNIRSAGDEVEISIRDFFRKRLLSKYHVGTGHIIDSRQKVSQQLDIIISDEHKNPVFCELADKTELFYYEPVYAYAEVKKSYYQDDLLDKFCNFYRGCLGLTTDKNDKLRTKNFYNDTFSFIEKNITHPEDVKGLKKALQVYVRENTTGIISASDFSKRHLTGCTEQKLYESEVVAKYPHSFTLDTTLLSKQKLDVERISLGRGVTIVSNTDLQDVEVLSNPTKEDIKFKMETGRVKSVVFLMEKE